jgi:hypothetical protein
VANVYSHLFYRTLSLPQGDSPLYAVDSTHVGVIRCVTAVAQSSQFVPAGGFQLENDGVPFVGVFDRDVRPRKFYTWDMHVVVAASTLISGGASTVSTPPWAVTISGYLLSLP